MATLLELIIHEWNMYIMFALFCILFGGADLIGAIPARYQPRADGEPLWRYIWVQSRNEWPPLKSAPKGYNLFIASIADFCRLFLIFIWLHIYHMGVLLAGILLDHSSSLAPAGWIILGICTVYSILFIHSWRRFIALKPNGFSTIFFFLASYPFFGLALSLACFYGISLWDGTSFSFQTYSREWAQSHFWGACLISIPWLVYFTVSSKVQLWHSLQKEWNGSNSD